jgi:hypothetical protein
MNKIVARIRGGIGNQLFIYAAARRLSLINNIELLLDVDSGFSRDFVYKRKSQLNHFNISCQSISEKEVFFPFPRVHRLLRRLVNNKLPFCKRSYIYQEGVDYDHRLETLKVSRNLYLEGYWQSERYFKDIEYVIRNDLAITPPNDDKNKALMKFIKNSLSVSLHIRYFDDALQETMVDYYAKAIETVNLQYPQSHYFIFCENMDKAIEFLNLPKGKFTLVGHNNGDDVAYCDLWLISGCKHHIIANSTFSWWGAWLSASKSKTVIAPDPKRFNDGNFWKARDLIPPDWRVV